MAVEIERKFLLRQPPSGRTLVRLGADMVRIEQTYLAVEGPARVRVRRSERDAGVTFTRTAKRKVGYGVRDEAEFEITKREYQILLRLADPRRLPVRKRRYVFGYAGRIFELDQIVAPRRLWLLEVELPNRDDLYGPLLLPGQLEVAREVTGVSGFSNAALARR